MSSYKDKDGHVVFECDDCGEQTGGETADFGEAFRDAVEEGFSYQGNGKHNCGCDELPPKNDIYGDYR